MWNNGVNKTAVIEHGVTEPSVNYKGTLDKGIVVINNLPSRGRLLGFDIFKEVSKHIPLDLVGMGTEEYGLGEVLHTDLPAFISQYRFFFNPIRYTSLGLAVLEAMMLGMPVVGLATTELAVTIQNGKNGIIHTDVDYLIKEMKQLLDAPERARGLGAEGKKTVRNHFNIQRFTADWKHLFGKTILNSRYNNHKHEENRIH